MSDKERTLFRQVHYDLSGLLLYIDIGDLGLPDIQRPFVWTPAKARDLFDSMDRGFPVGYLLFWANAEVSGTRPIGVGEKSQRGTEEGPQLDLLDPSVKLMKKALDRHHLFPRAWLESKGVTDLRLINQVANFALLEWPDNTK